MRRPIIVVFLSLFLMACQAVAAERGALFRITGQGHTLYVFGTIHAGQPDYYPLEPRLRAVLAEAPTLALEIDALRDPDAVAAAFREFGMFAPGSAGYAGLPAARRLRIETALRRQGVDPAAVASMKPWLLTVMLAAQDLAKLGYDPALGVDAHLAAQARGKVRIVELETVRAQAALLDRLPLAMQWEVLEDTLAQMASGEQLREARDMFSAYERADRRALDALAARIEADDSASGRYLREVVLDERNGPMADKLAALLAREDNALAAVGILHLLGKRGVPELLRQRGMTVERVY